jgi:hypothetical protein
VTFPTIHLNGTSASELVEAIETAARSIETVCDDLMKTAPNMRDYYPQKDGTQAFERARDALQSDLTAMHNILHRLRATWENINEQTSKG